MVQYYYTGDIESQKEFRSHKSYNGKDDLLFVTVVMLYLQYSIINREMYQVNIFMLCQFT